MKLVYGQGDSVGCIDWKAVQTTDGETTPLLWKGKAGREIRQTRQIDTCCQGDAGRATVSEARGHTDGLSQRSAQGFIDCVHNKSPPQYSSTQR